MILRHPQVRPSISNVQAQFARIKLRLSAVQGLLNNVGKLNLISHADEEWHDDTIEGHRQNTQTEACTSSEEQHTRHKTAEARRGCTRI
jgi:hypothetical protein